jgi:hypothetical protein
MNQLPEFRLETNLGLPAQDIAVATDIYWKVR